MSGKILVSAGLVLAAVLLGLVFLHAVRPMERYELGRGDTRELPLPDYGRLRLNVTAAGVEIVPGRTGVVRIHVQRVADAARIAQRVHGSSAEVDISNLGNNSQVLIEVPRHTDLDVDLSAGELKIRGVAGAKDLSLRAGRIELETPSSDYGRVSAFVLTGRIFAPVFGDDTGGIWRSRRWRGEGHSRVNATVLAGEVFLKSSDPAQISDAHSQD